MEEQEYKSDGPLIDASLDADTKIDMWAKKNTCSLSFYFIPVLVLSYLSFLIIIFFIVII